MITRRSLPHWYVPGATHFVTYRLAETLPAKVRQHLNDWRDRMLGRPTPAGLSVSEYRLRIHKQLFARYDKFLDRGTGRRWLADPRVAIVVRSNLYHHHGGKYHLMAYCIMPNHVHVLLLPNEEHAGAAPAICHVGESEDKRSPLAKIMHSLKSYTANEANRILERRGSFWQRESYDHWVRDDDELERIVNYIRHNPVAAGLTDVPENWPWCSCRDRFLQDGDKSGWLVRHAAGLPGF